MDTSYWRLIPLISNLSPRRREVEDAVSAGGGGEPGAGHRRHQLLAHTPRVPCLPRPYHPSHQTVHQGETYNTSENWTESRVTWFALIASPVCLIVRHVDRQWQRRGTWGWSRWEKPWEILSSQQLSGFQIAEVPMPVPPDGLQGGTQLEC